MDKLRKTLTLLSILAALALSACGPAIDDGDVDYSVSARENFERGAASLKEKRWVSAAKYFSFVKGRFPYSRYAVLAELGLADAEFGAGNYLAAIENYKDFIKFHPTHPRTRDGYVSFRIAKSYYQMLPDNFWLYPPAHEKDQSATYDAEREFRTFLLKFPQSERRAEAQKMLTEVKRRLATHEWYVAEFYWKKKRYLGTALRLRRLLSRYGKSGYDAKALMRLGDAYTKLRQMDRARAAYAEFARRFPKHQDAGKARKLSGS